MERYGEAELAWVLGYVPKLKSGNFQSTFRGWKFFTQPTALKHLSIHNYSQECYLTAAQLY